MNRLQLLTIHWTYSPLLVVRRHCLTMAATIKEKKMNKYDEI